MAAAGEEAAEEEQYVRHEVALPGGRAGRVLEWKAREGARVKKGAALAVYAEGDEQQAVGVLTSPSEGEVVALLVEAGASVRAGRPLVVVRQCVHSTVYGGLCVVCHRPVDAPEGGSNLLVVGGARQTLVMSDSAVRREADAMTRRLRRERRLLLVLDIDHTILHASNDPRAGALHAAGEPGVHRLRLGKATHHVKLRPGLAEFLGRAKELFHMHVYTMGVRRYAEAVLRVVDPAGTFFAGRVVSRDDMPGKASKELQRLVPCDPSMVLILDDTVDVWTEQAPNVVWAHRFTRFGGLSETYVPPDVAAARAAGDETAAAAAAASSQAAADRDTVLGSVWPVLEAAHTMYYGGAHQTVPRILRGVSRSVLDGVVLLFTRVFPTGLSDARKKAHPLWRMAKHLGARVCEGADFAGVTHVVAEGEQDTSKVRFGRSKEGVHVVHSAWLLHCGAHLARASEADFPFPYEGDWRSAIGAGPTPAPSAAAVVERAAAYLERSDQRAAQAAGGGGDTPDEPGPKRRRTGEDAAGTGGGDGGALVEDLSFDLLAEELDL